VTKKQPLVTLLLALSLTLTSCNTSAKGVNNSEIMAGDAIHQRILSEYYVYTETRVTEYVQSVGVKISDVANREMGYEFIVLYSDKMFTASAPGGRVYITTALLAFLENEAELAGVLAHEVGQLQYRDPEFSTTRKVAEGLHQVSAVAAPFFGIFGVVAILGTAGFHAASSVEKTKQDRVEFADKVALFKLVDAGYDPQGLLDFIYRLTELGPASITSIMDYYWSRPVNVERVEKLKLNFKKLPLENREFHSHRKRYLTRIKPVLTIYETPQAPLYTSI
jgi:predicted Zn-dependent protease